MEKRFIRFVCNTSNHPRGEKIKTINIITKIYDDKGVFIKLKKPYIKALENQIEVDIEGTDYKKYAPPHHYKNDNGNIVKKSDAEIQTLEAEITQQKLDKQAALVIKEQEISNPKTIVVDETKADSVRLAAMINIQKKEGKL